MRLRLASVLCSFARLYLIRIEPVGVPHMVGSGDCVIVAWRGSRVGTASGPVAAIQP